MDHLSEIAKLLLALVGAGGLGALIKTILDHRNAAKITDEDVAARKQKRIDEQEALITAARNAHMKQQDERIAKLEEDHRKCQDDLRRINTAFTDLYRQLLAKGIVDNREAPPT